MTTSISIKKVLVGVAAVALLASPLFAMADAYMDGLNADIVAAEAAALAAEEAAEKDGKVSPDEQTAVDAANREVGKAKQRLRDAEVARAAAARRAGSVVGGGVGTVAPPYDIAKNPGELEAIGAALGAAGLGDDEEIAGQLAVCKDAAKALQDAIAGGASDAAIGAQVAAEIECLKKLKALLSSKAMGNAAVSNIVLSVQTKITNVTRWNATRVAEAKKNKAQQAFMARVGRNLKCMTRAAADAARAADKLFAFGGASPNAAKKACQAVLNALTSALKKNRGILFLGNGPVVRPPAGGTSGSNGQSTNGIDLVAFCLNKPERSRFCTGPYTKVICSPIAANIRPVTCPVGMACLDGAAADGYADCVSS